jgi:hypothetical protein
MKNFITNHKQLTLTLILALLVLIIFGIFSLFGGNLSQAEQFKTRADRYFATGDYSRAVNFYNLALESDPLLEEVYIILYEYYIETNNREPAWDIISRANYNINSETIRVLYAEADYPVLFPNETIETSIREILNMYYVNSWHDYSYNIADDETIWRSFLDAIDWFALIDVETDNLEFLEHFKNLTTLGLVNSVVNDFSFINKHPTLTAIYAEYDETMDYSVFTGLEQIYFNIEISPDIDLTPITKINIPVYISAVFFEQWDLSPLMALSGMENLQLSIYNIREQKLDFSPLYDFAGHIELTFNQGLSDFSVLTEIKSLRGLSVFGESSFEIDLSPLGELTELRKLVIFSHNSTVYDLSPLANLINLESLVLSSNNIKDISPLENLTSLTELSLMFCTGITDFTPIANLVNLRELNLTGIPLDDVSFLSGMSEDLVLHLDPHNTADLTPILHIKDLRRG